MADLFNDGINSGSRDEIIKEILAAFLDAANSSKQFSNELKDNVKNASKLKRDTQSIMSSMLSETKKANKEADRLADTLKRINDSFPQTVKSMLDSTEKGLAFQTRKLEMGFKLEKLLNPLFNEFRLEKKQELNDLNDEISKLEKLFNSAKDSEEKQTFETLKNIKLKQKAELEGLDDFQVAQRQNSKYFFDQSLKISKKVLDSIYQFAMQKITSAISNYNSTMQQTYTLIQSYNNYTISQYDALFNRLKESITEAGLDKIININELQQSYANTVQGGLFGNAAEKNAYYKQIAEQAGITFDWTDSNWMKTVSRLQKTGTDLDLFMQQIITTTENITEAAGNGFAFTSGQINTMIDNLNRLQVSLDLTDEAYISAYRSFGTAGSMLNEWNIDASKIYADITDYAEKGITASSTAQILNLGGLTQARIREKISAGKTDELVINYLSELQGRYDKTTGEFVNVASNALSESLSNEEILAYQNYIKYLSDNNKSVEDEYKRIYNYNEWAYDNMVDSLSNTETATDRIANWTDNFFSSLGKFVNEHPFLGTAGGALFSGATGALGGWFSSGLGRKTIQTLLQGGGSDNLNPLQGMFNNASKSEAAGAFAKSGGLGSLLKNTITNGTAFSGSGSTLMQGIGKTAFSTAGKAIGGGLGIAFTAKDLISGIQEGGFEGGIKKMFTGSSGTATSGGQVALGTLGGVAKGASIGMIGGPFGMAIGAAIGGLGALTIGLNDLSDTTKQSKLAMERTNKLFNNVSDGLTKFTENQKTIETTQKEINDLQIHAIPPDDLLKKYPTLTSSLDEAGQVTTEYKDLLQQLIDVEKRKNADELAKLYYNEQDEAGWNNVSTTFTSLHNAKNFLDAVKDPGTKITRGQHGKGFYAIKSDGSKVVISESEAKHLGLTWDDLKDRDSRDFSDAIDTANLEYNTDYRNALKTAEQTAKSYSSSMINWFKGYNIDPKKEIPKKDATYLFRNLQKASGGRWDIDFAKSLVNYNNALSELKESGVDLKKSSYISPTIMKHFLEKADDFDKSGATNMISGMHPAFAVGTIGDATVPYDNYLAYLHKGEQIRTAAEVSIEKAEQHVASSNAIGQLNTVVLKQTDAIINLLTQILDVTTRLSNRGNNGKSGPSYDYSAATI